MEFKGTKGEWYVGESAGDVKAKGVKGLLATAWSVYDSEETEIREEGESWLDMRHRTASIRNLKDLETQSNAKLIAAAPDLLEALQGFVNLEDLISYKSEVSAEHNGEAQAVHSAIQKAKQAIEKALK